MSWLSNPKRRATVLVMIVGLLAALFLTVTAYITLARFDNLTANAARKSQRVEEALRNVNTFVRSTLRQALADADGHVLAGGRARPKDPNDPKVLATYAPEDIPGYGGSRWLAGTEMVRDHTSPLDPNEYATLPQYKQTVSSFGDPAAKTTAVPLVPLLPSLDGLMLQDDPNWRGGPFRPIDLERNVRRPFMDADGDGVPDSSFVGTAPLTDMANAVAKIAVRAPTYVDYGNNRNWFYPSAIADPNAPVLSPAVILARQWRRFDAQARYEVAAKVISNGGLVALSSPGNYTGPGTVWNRQFVAEMFRWIRHGRDDPWVLPYTDPIMSNPNITWNDLSAGAAQVEPLLRLRGGLLASFAEEQLDAIPRLLERLRNTYRYTFGVNYTEFWPRKDQQKTDAWQRFNLAGIVQAPMVPDEWPAYSSALALDADPFNKWWPTKGGPDPSNPYIRRHLLTTISNSDELARKTNPALPVAPRLYDVGRSPSAPDTGLGLYPGELKFHLGDIADAFYSERNLEGRFHPQDWTGPAKAGGHTIIRRLADYYYEMLSDYAKWGNLSAPGVQTGSSEVVSQRQQAFMLAVNTVAFAAPRNTQTGFIDVVWYPDSEPAGTVRTYVGYAPQPFITQVVAHSDGGTNPPIALGVELYNPNDPGLTFNPGRPKPNLDNPTDAFALDLSQFGLSIAVPGEQPQIAPLNLAFGAQRWSGRTFVTVSIGHSKNSTLKSNFKFDGQANPDLPVATYYDGMHRVIELTLWRRGSRQFKQQPEWWVVDKLKVGDDPTARIPLRDPTTGKENCFVMDYHRDAGATPFFGGSWATPKVDACWRVACDLHAASAKEGKDPRECSTLPVRSYVSQLGNPNPVLSTPLAPVVPLYTMNAGANPWVVHGAPRPASFPTVGFLLFVPRFSHVTTSAGSHPMSETLRRQWLDTDPPLRPAYNLATESYPADFGHMWIFDNHQPVTNGTYLDTAPDKPDNNQAALPWGLLVFDYFTTLNPLTDINGDGKPDLDPLRVPGRININAAPWYVLAGLPLLTPTTEATPGDISKAASPAFWSTKSGVFVGNVTLPPPYSATVPRFDTTATKYTYQNPSTPRWYHLGPYLAQAAASYRDGLLYVSDRNPNPPYAPFHFPRAEQRNAPGFMYRQDTGGPFQSYAYGPIRRANGAQGFLSLGELINVYGFDSPVFNPNAPSDPSSIVYRPLGQRNWPQAIPPDFFKAVSLMALLDTHFLTTRSNTFTVYVSVTDRQNPQASLRSQLTVDRSNLLPKLVTDASGRAILQDTNGDAKPDKPIVIENDGLPEILTQRQTGYFNTQFDW